jgi:hypothetical protein
VPKYIKHATVLVLWLLLIFVHLVVVPLLPLLLLVAAVVMTVTPHRPIAVCHSPRQGNHGPVPLPQIHS